MRKIIKIGTFDSIGRPTGWHIDMGNTANKVAYAMDSREQGAVLEITQDGNVCVNGIEIVEWTNKRNEIMEKGKK